MDDLDKAFPIGWPHCHQHWDTARLLMFRAVLKIERDPRGKYVMNPDPVEVTPVERPRRPENAWDINHSDWSGGGMVGGKRK